MPKASASGRARVSPEPPAAEGTISRTGRSAQAQATALRIQVTAGDRLQLVELGTARVRMGGPAPAGVFRAGGTATLRVTLGLKAADVPASVDVDLAQVSGNVILTSGSETLTVGALLVPRPSSKVSASISGSLNNSKTAASLVVSNKGSVSAGDADVYTWGLQDRKDQRIGGGFDLQAAGVQSFDLGTDQLMVFAVSTHDRYSNAASVEFDILIDTDRDGKDDFAVFSYDFGLVTAGDADGRNGVFVYNLKTGDLTIDFLAGSPTDSSTVLLPVLASALGVDGPFAYTVVSFYGDSFDQFDTQALYDPAAKALSDGDNAVVPAGGRVSLPVTKDQAAFSVTRPLGLMVVSFDNPAGGEASLIRVN